MSMRNRKGVIPELVSHSAEHQEHDGYHVSNQEGAPKPCALAALSLRWSLDDFA